VKHAPKTDEEILDGLVKKHSLLQTSNRRVNKDALEELKQMKQKVAERELRMANASDVSDVETVKPSNILFSVDLNLENLQEHLRRIKAILVS